MSAWRVEFDRGTAFVTGSKTEARRRLAACGDRSPLWVQRRDAWATSPAAARRLIDQLEARNIGVTIDDVAQGALDLTATTAANVLPDRPEGLW